MGETLRLFLALSRPHPVTFVAEVVTVGHRVRQRTWYREPAGSALEGFAATAPVAGGNRADRHNERVKLPGRQGRVAAAGRRILLQKGGPSPGPQLTRERYAAREPCPRPLFKE